MVEQLIESALIKWRERGLPIPDSIIMPPHLATELILRLRDYLGILYDIKGNLKYMGLDIIVSDNVKGVRIAKTNPIE